VRWTGRSSSVFDLVRAVMIYYLLGNLSLRAPFSFQVDQSGYNRLLVRLVGVFLLLL
jgi:hypothetical protein